MASGAIKSVFIAVIAVFSVFLIESIAPAESLEDDIIERENASIFLKDGTCIECSRFWWFVSVADFIQCDKGDRAVEVKIGDVDFEKTFGSALAKEYADKKNELAEDHEKSKKKMKENVVTYDSSEKSQQENQPKYTSSSKAGSQKDGESLEELERELEKLKEEIKQAESSKKLHQQKIKDAEGRLAKRPGYLEMVQRQKEIKELIDKNRAEGKSTQGLTEVLIDASRNLERIMHQDKEVKKAMDALRPLSLKTHRLKGKIAYYESKIEKLRGTKTD